MFRPEVRISLWLTFVLVAGFYHPACDKLLSAEASTDSLILENKERYVLGPYLEFFEDSTRRISLDQIRSETNPIKFEKNAFLVAALGYTSSAIWVKLRLHNHSTANKSWLLEYGSPIIDRVEAYIPSDDGNYILHRMGNTFPFSEREWSHRNPVFSVNTPPQKAITVYVRLESENAIQVSLTLFSSREFIKETKVEYGLFGILYGCLIVMLFYNLFIFISVRDTAYLYYVIYILCMIFAQLATNGHTFEFLWPRSTDWNKYSLLLFVVLLLCSAGQFSRAFLRTRQFSPWIDRVIIGLIAVIILSGALAMITRSVALAGPVITFAGAFLPVVLMAAGIQSVRRGYHPARYFLIAWSVLLVGLTLYTLKTLGLVPYNFFTDNVLDIGTVLEMMLLSLGLADRINTMKEDLSHKELEKERLAKESEMEKIHLIEAKKVELEKKVLERTYDLRVKNEELAKLNEKKNEYLGFVAHDLRNPLTTIIGYIDLVIDDIRNGRFRSESGIKDLSKISKVGTHMAGFISELLDISAIESGKVRLDIKDAFIEDILKETQILHERQAEQKNITLKVQTMTGLPAVRIDRQKISSVIDNLLTNAFKYTFPGGTVKLYGEIHGKEVWLHVEDNGQGLDENDLQTIFTSFKRLSARPTGGESSTGLGLAIVKKTVEIHGGRVWVESKKGKGSVFSFSLPLS